MIRIGAIVGFALAAAAHAGDLSFAQQQSLPPWVLRVFEGGRQSLTACACLNPFYLRGDFDGDGRADYAVQVQGTGSRKRGIAVVHARDRSVHLLGAGTRFGNGGDDFSWLDAWRVYERAPVERGAGDTKAPALVGDALWLEKTEASSGLAYWDGARYRWYQQGD